MISKEKTTKLCSLTLILILFEPAAKWAEFDCARINILMHAFNIIIMNLFVQTMERRIESLISVIENQQEQLEALSKIVSVQNVWKGHSFMFSCLFLFC